MGLLSTGGRPLNWGEEQMNNAIPHIIEHGVTQLLNIYQEKKNDCNRPFLWGEEIEAVLCVVDEGGDSASSASSSSAEKVNKPRTTRVWLKAKEVMDYLNEHDPEGAIWQPEYASCMVETVPKKPYTGSLEDLASVQDNMQNRYDAMARVANALYDQELQDKKNKQEQQQQDASTSSSSAAAAASSGSSSSSGSTTTTTTTTTTTKTSLHRGTRVAAVTLVSFPLLGVPGNFIEGGEDLKPLGKYAKSLFVPDEVTNQSHPRFSYLTQNIRLRRGRKVCIQIPMYMDVNTMRDTVDPQFSIDYHPNNYLIDCTPETDKARHVNAFSSSEDEDEEDSDSDSATTDSQQQQQQPQVKTEADTDTATTATTSSTPSQKNKAKSKNTKKKSNDEKANKSCCEPLVTSATSATTSQQQQQLQHHEHHHHQQTFQNHFRHLFTPSTHYFYAQYINLHADREAHVRERFNACPCPTPVRENPCVYMDCMAFGMGLNCLQVTMQWANMSEARHMYDQLVPIAPLLLALASATPFQKGILTDSDVRWLTISASVDCRKRDEVPRIIKSRYDNVSMYISDKTQHLDKYNDEHVHVNDQVKQRILDSGADEILATHFAHLFIRDPLVIFEKAIDVDDSATTVHFENIQSTNWQSMRFKPPPPGQDAIGWRTELRTMDIQLTAFENAAFSAFSVLLAKAIHKFNLFTIVPMSLVSMNMGAAHMRDPVNTQRFWWRNNCTFTDVAPTPCNNSTCQNSTCTNNDDAELNDKNNNSDFSHMTLNQIFNGCLKFEGFVPLIRRYIKEEGLGHNSRVEAYIELVSQRASGKLKTAANFLRDFVLSHPTYKKDSRLTPEVAHDIVVVAEKMGRGDTAFEGFLPAELLQAAKRRRGRD